MEYNKPTYIKFDKGQEDWEDLFFCLLKFIQSSKKTQFDFDIVKASLIDILTEVFLTDEEISSDSEEEQVCSEEEDNSLASEQEFDTVTKESKEK